MNQGQNMDFLLIAIKVVDGFLAVPAVRWLLLLSVVVMSTITGFSMSRQYVLSLQLDAAKGQVATYETHLKIQNEAIVKAGEEAKMQQQKITEANAKAKDIKNALEDWRKKVNEIKLVGTCEQMVDQVITAVKE